MQRLWSADELGERWSLLPNDQEASVHALHLLQSCLIYVNTLMRQ